MDIFQAAGLFIQKIGALAGTVQAAGKHYFGKIPEFFGCITVVIGHKQGDLRHIQRCSGIGTRKDNIFHGLAAQLFDTLFTHDPAQCIYDIAFAAAVGTDHGRNSGGAFDSCFVIK